MTNSEIIRELGRDVVRHDERLNNLQDQIKRVDLDRSKASDSLIEIDRKVAVLEDNICELKRVADEAARRRFTVAMAVLGCVLTLIANVLPTYLRWSR